ncbi:MAG TPA: dockerin type I domain-containing protein [Candidatus Saccharimonadales bacterium]|nr:dockerin type I domain-containing protein [Candidatus Saccharimonadales bacterium]
MKFLKSKGFLVAVTVFLLISIPLTTYVVLNTAESSKETKAATVCEKDCVDKQTPSNTEAVKEDINQDGLVNSADLSILLVNKGKTGANSADLNGDGVVNDSDVSLLISKWSK